MSIYTKQTWTDNVTPVDKAHMDTIETGIFNSQFRDEKGVANGYASLDANIKIPVAQLPILSGAELAAAQITSDISTASTTAVDLVTIATGVTFENVKYYVEIAAQLLRQTAAGNAVIFALNVDGAGVTGVQSDCPGGANGSPVFFRIAWTPTAGAHTVKIQWNVSAGTGTLRLTGYAPAQFRIVKA